MIEMLERHYAPPPSKPAGGRLITEIQAPHSTRRADALYLPITTSGRGHIIGHEVKVTRSDTIAELRDPHKADAWMRHCHRWWLVVADPAHLDGLDIPPEWGVLAPPSRANTRFMTVIQKAPLLTPDPSRVAEAWGTIFAKVAYADLAEMRALERWMGEAAEWKRREGEARAEVRRLSNALGADLGDSLGRRGKALQVADIIAAVERLGGYGDDAPAPLRGMSWSVEPEMIARGILTAALADRQREYIADDLRASLNRAESAAEKLRAALADYERQDRDETE
ncbi:hypothetical protein [Microbacterium phage MO526]|uniref:Holliday junction resolvase n=1 Tax=Microbacterium phage MO526 TaxID=3108092 RepID=A0ABZ0ZX58_9CAUD|nr:hypothetical protein [Microbacterium phage MO526]